jgi:hypothetical protein
MKTTNNFYYMILIMIFFSAFMYCGGNGSSNGDTNNSDSTSGTRIDSVNATLHDPASAFPQPPVTGNQTDSSRTLDSSKGKKH